MRGSFAHLVLCVALALAGCGASDEAAMGQGPWQDPAACDLRALAQTLPTRSDGCPPASCVIDGAQETVECHGRALVVGGMACTTFSDPGGSCSTFCAPPSCFLSSNGVVECSDGCSFDHTTCFAVAESLCPGAD